MRAAFSDPQGSPLWRGLLYAPTALLVILAFVLARAGLESWWALAMAGAASAAVAGLVPTRQRARRAVELECGPGYLDVKEAGTRTQRIDAKSLDGATTARTSRGFLLTLSHAKRSAPLTIEVPTEPEVEQIRRALGIGHGGVGAVSWRTVPSANAKAVTTGRVIVLVCGLIIIALLAIGASTEAAVIGGVAMSQLLIVGAALSLVAWTSKSPTPNVVMAADALRLWTPRGWFTLPYDQLIDVRIEEDRLVFVVPPPFNQIVVARKRPWSGDGLSDEEAASLVAQLKAAAARARGLGPQKTDVTGRVEVLRRGGESPRDWLVRLDMAGQTLATGTGYRGNTLDAQDLWAILEDPEADAELRAAAARVLRHTSVQAARVRIAAAVAAVRDEATHKKLRIAIADDLDGASQELAVLDAQERPGQHAAWPPGVRG